MRTRTERIEARRDVMSGVGDHDVTMVQAILELCSTLDDLGERLVDSNDETRKALDALAADIAKTIRAVAP
jgi:hypothetical protein